MPTLADLSALIQTLGGDLYELRLSPRPARGDWRNDRPTLEVTQKQRDKCRHCVDACQKALEAVKRQFPASWLGDDPQTSKYIRLKKSLSTISRWLNEVQREFRGFKMPMDSDAQDQHDRPADVRSWEEAEAEMRQLGAELKDWIDLQSAKGAAAPVQVGAAFAAAMESDAKANAAWERARAKLKAYIEAMHATNAESADDLRGKLDELTEAIREGLRASGDELAAQGFNSPATIEDWEYLARIVGIPPETIRAGSLNARELHACALARADRQKIKGELSASANAPTSTEPPATVDIGDSANGDAPALTKAERLTLCTLAGFDASILASVRQIAEAMDPAEALSERTITPAIRKLVDLDLAERPEGERQGVRLTLKGRRLATKIAG